MADTPASHLQSRLFGAGWLMQQTFPPVRYVVDGVIPEGMTLLVAAPKIGKSWLVLGLGLAVSSGQPAFGVIPTGKPRPVLYLALEDGPRRLQSRLHALNAKNPTDVLAFVTEVPRGDVIACAQEFVDKYPNDAPVIILDTLGKVMPAAAPGESDYQRDYRVGGALKAVADSVPGCSVIVVHHSRKAMADDFLDSVSGTQGLAGSADTIILLRRDRLAKTGTLSVTSRDAEEGEYGLRIEGAGTWTLDGADLHEAAAAARDSKAVQGVGDRMADVIAKVTQYPEGAKPGDIATMLGMSKDDAGKYLRRAAEAGRIERTGRGVYTPVRSVRTSDSLLSFGHTDTSDIGGEAA